MVRGLGWFVWERAYKEEVKSTIKFGWRHTVERY